MELIATTDADTQDLLRLIEDTLHSSPFEIKALGIPACIDGRDAFQVIAPCGCIARMAYDHTDAPGPGFELCDPQPAAHRMRGACQGHRAIVPTVAELVACTAHADTYRNELAAVDRDDLADAILDETGELPGWAMPSLNARFFAEPVQRVLLGLMGAPTAA
ncbi:MAG: hypothetical protein QOJ67_2515 [Acidimicrobiaceae bacterium]|jgi:hypothetical protein